MTSLSVDNALSRLAYVANELKTTDRQCGRVRQYAASVFDFAVRCIYHVWRNRYYLTPIKMTNMALINVQCKFKTQRVIGMPYRIKIEATNICNTNCQLCPTGLGFCSRPKGKMEFAQFTRFIDQHRRYIYTLDLSMWGDPLIAPDIYRMIRYAHDSHIWTYLSSNLHAFRVKRGDGEKLVNSKLDMLTCSLHGASQGTYSCYQPGKQFDKTIDKVKGIVEAKKRLGSQTPEIQLNFVVTRHNQHEIDRFKTLADSLECKAVFSAPSLNVRFLDRDKNLVPLGLSGEALNKKTLDYMREWLPDDEDYIIEPYRKIREGRPGSTGGKKMVECHWPWKDSVINWDGSVVICCGVYEKTYDMGNVFDTPFHAIWNNRAYRSARRSFTRKVAEQPGVSNPCRTCPGFML